MEPTSLNKNASWNQPCAWTLPAETSVQELPGIFWIADDLLINGQSDTEEEADKNHDANLVRSMSKMKREEHQLNKAKFDFNR